MHRRTRQPDNVSSLFTKNKKPENPNIVFILADDLGYGDLSCLNPDSKIKTPNIDRMSSSRVTFLDAHSASGVSSSTRYGILTGRYSFRSTMKNGILDGYSGALIPPSRKTIVGMLRAKGYSTAFIGKWHLGWDWNNSSKGKESVDFSKPIANGPVTRGFDYFHGFSGSPDMPPYVYVEKDMPTLLPDRETTGNNAPVEIVDGCSHEDQGQYPVPVMDYVFHRFRIHREEISFFWYYLAVRLLCNKIFLPLLPWRDIVPGRILFATVMFSDFSSSSINNPIDSD